MSDDYRPVEFGAQTAGEVYDKHYGQMPDIVKTYNKKGKLVDTKYLTDDTGDEPEPTVTAHGKQWEKDKQTATVTGSWVKKANPYAERLYDEDGLNYNDMRKYAAGAGIKDINSENDIQGIRDHIDSTYTSQDELDESHANVVPEEAEETNPAKQQRPVQLSDKVVEAKERTQAYAAGAGDGSFLNNYKLNLNGSAKPRKPIEEL